MMTSNPLDLDFLEKLNKKECKMQTVNYGKKIIGTMYRKIIRTSSI